MNFETVATTPVVTLEAEQKEEALQKNKIFKMREQLQLSLMTELGYDIRNPDKVAQFQAISQWAHNESSKDFERAFNNVMEEHPDLLKTFEQDQQTALALIREAFNSIHQHA